MKKKKPLTKVVNGREVKNEGPQNIKEDRNDNAEPPSSGATGPVTFAETLNELEQKTAVSPTAKEEREVKGFTGTGGAGGAGHVDRETSNVRKNGGQIKVKDSK